ncbi:MAG: hypothetical protein OEV44_07520 [Spirochaetota bacterium]|nr:hypothetical protein [Spirochaetota bacterium]
MIRKYLLLSFITIIFITYGNFNSYTWEKRVKFIKLNKCIEVWTVKRVIEGEAEWYVFAGNKCSDTKYLGKRVKITVAKNVMVQRGWILESKEFLIPSLDRKLLFMTSQADPGKKSALSWKLIR